MIYTAIVEDNKKDAERLLSFQERYGKEHKLVQQCQWFSDAEKFLKSDTRRFDIVFMDPPYDNELECQVLEYLKDSTVVDENTLIIVEADLQTDFGYLESLGYRLLRSKEYKTNKHVFLERV